MSMHGSVNLINDYEYSVLESEKYLEIDPFKTSKYEGEFVRVDLERNWEAISFLITGASKESTLFGGKISKHIDLHGELLSKEWLCKFRNEQAEEKYLNKFDHNKMNELGLYNSPWKESDLIILNKILNELYNLSLLAEKYKANAVLLVA